MAKKSNVLIISAIALVFIAVILIFSPIFKSKPLKIEPGLTYQDTIMPEDPPNNPNDDYRCHIYSINVFSREKYTFEVNSLSDDVILLLEYRDNKKYWLMEVEAGVSGTIEYTVNSAGQKILYVEALAAECPAEYELKITKL